tara:strand:+ start:314 stop:1972 length:1659 start_codon:yes stop_codon:yes gene_type:complete
MKHVWLSLFLWILIAQAAVAQSPIDFNLLVNRTHTERVFLLNDYYERGIATYDSIAIAQQIEQLNELAALYNDPALSLEAEVVRAHYLCFAKNLDKHYVVDELNQLIQPGEKKEVVWFQVRIHSLLGHYYFDRMDQYEYALVHLTKAANLMNGLPFEDYPFKYLCNAHVASILFRFEDYDGAIAYFRKSISPETHDSFSKRNVTSYNSIGLIYRKFNQLDSADLYFRKTLEVSKSYNNPWWEGIASGNLGENHYLRGEFEEAIPLLNLDLERAVESSDFGLASNALIVLGNIALKQNETKKASALLNKARSFAYRTEDWKRLATLYPGMAKLAGQEGNARLVALYTDSTLIVNDSLGRVRSSLLTTRAQQKLEREKHQDELTIIGFEREREIWQRNAILILLILVMILSAFGLFRLWNKFQGKNKELVEAEKKLLVFTKQLAEKHTLVNAEAGEALVQLQGSTLLTDADWDSFKVLFETVHNGFFKRLEEAYAGLSPSDIRFIALTKLNLSAKEMAGVLGVGNDTIRQYRRRLRKRLSLSVDDDLEELIAKI